MEIIIRKYWWLLLLLLLGLSSGCTVTLKKDADLGVRFGTEVSLFHNSPDDGAVAELNLTDWIIEIIRQEMAATNEVAEEVPIEPD